MNFVFYRWGRWCHKWLYRKRFATVQAALAGQGNGASDGVVIDLATGRCVWRNGKACNQKKPIGIRSLPAVDLPEALTTAEAPNQPVRKP